MSRMDNRAIRLPSIAEIPATQLPHVALQQSGTPSSGIFSNNREYAAPSGHPVPYFRGSSRLNPPSARGHANVGNLHQSVTPSSGTFSNSREYSAHSVHPIPYFGESSRLNPPSAHGHTNVGNFACPPFGFSAASVAMTSFCNPIIHSAQGASTCRTPPVIPNITPVYDSSPRWPTRNISNNTACSTDEPTNHPSRLTSPASAHNSSSSHPPGHPHQVYSQGVRTGTTPVALTFGVSAAPCNNTHFTTPSHSISTMEAASMDDTTLRAPPTVALQPSWPESGFLLETTWRKFADGLGLASTWWPSSEQLIMKKIWLKDKDLTAFLLKQIPLYVKKKREIAMRPITLLLLKYRPTLIEGFDWSSTNDNDTVNFPLEIQFYFEVACDVRPIMVIFLLM